MLMSLNLKVLKENKNDTGELRTKVVEITNSENPKEGLAFDTINDLYQELLTKYKAGSITITAKPMDGNFVTLKARRYLESNLKHADEEYYSSLPAEVKDKLQGHYYSVIVTIQI